MGVSVEPNLEVNREGIMKYLALFSFWLRDLLNWLFLLSVGIGLANLLPIWVVDGGRMFYTFLGSFILGALGFIIGLWAEKFDNMASATNFIIVPLSFLSGTFYSIRKLPEILQEISEWNPFFYMIDGFRYGVLGVSDGSIKFGLSYLITLSVLTWFVSYILFKKGYKIKS